MPGHEQFAPLEKIVSESDEVHLPDGPSVQQVEAAWLAVGPNAYAKREYSEASRGVARDDGGSIESAVLAVQKVLLFFVLFFVLP